MKRIVHPIARATRLVLDLKIVLIEEAEHDGYSQQWRRARRSPFGSQWNQNILWAHRFLVGCIRVHIATGIGSG